MDDKPELPGLPETFAEAVPPVERWQPADPVFGTWSQLTRPLWAALDLRASATDLACLLLSGLGSLAIWAFFGAAITRIAAVQLATGERLGFAPALRFACAKFGSYFSAPLMPVGGIAVAAFPVWLLGWLMWANLGLFFVGLAWPVMLVCGLVMVLLLIGVLFGWPLMWSTISTEGTDSFDAMSRAYSYVYQRPVHYLLYATLAAVFGWLGWLLVKNFAAGVVWLSYWAAGWSAPQMDLITPANAYPEGIGHAGAVVIRFWAGCVKLLAVGFFYGYFWVAATAIYLLLRRDVDAAEMDEVFLDADESEKTYALPPLRTDAAGAPEVAEAAVEPRADANDLVPVEGVASGESEPAAGAPAPPSPPGPASQQGDGKRPWGEPSA